MIVQDERNGPAAADGAILVTGATGFVGGALLPELLAASDRQLICLVRADSDHHASQRGHEIIDHPRVRWIRADVEERQLGLSDGAWGELASVVTEVFHCAASTRFDLPLDEAQRINVDGTSHLLELAMAANLHRRELRACLRHLRLDPFIDLQNLGRRDAVCEQIAQDLSIDGGAIAKGGSGTANAESIFCAAAVTVLG